MKKSVVFSILVLISLCSFSQIKYLTGYFIDNNSKRTECFIKSKDPMNNPTEFDYKLTKNGRKENGNIKSVQEFGIEGVVKYIRIRVQIDRSPWKLEALSKEKEPAWSDETVFLKVLVEGKASLFYYKEGSLDRFFYSVNNSSIKQLVYKEYMINQSQSSFNNKFRQQLASDVRCSKTNANELANLYFSKNVLVKFFENYNSATGETALKYGRDGNKNLFHLKVTPGISNSSLVFHNRVSASSKFDFGTKILPRIGMELEFVLPWYMETWSVVFEPTFQYFRSNASVENPTSKINYCSIDIPLGLRHYFFLKNDIRIFVDGFFYYNSPILLSSEVFLSNSYFSTYKIQQAISMAFGAGLEYKRLSFETRYNTDRNIMLNDHNWKTGYKKFEIIFGIKIN